MSKAYLHMDEAYSFGLSQYDKIEIMLNDDFYDHWHDKDYYQDYLAVQEDEKWDLAPVYENQKNDVHPPLFYLLLRLMMETGNGEFSKWPGIILNIIIAAFNTIVFYAVVRKLLEGKQKSEQKSLILTALAGLTVAAVSTVVYIRMYMLLTLFVTLTVWLHLKLYETKKPNWKLLTAIGAVALAGVLTQYYYIFFLAPLWVVMAVKYAKEKNWKTLGLYTGTLLSAGVLSLIIWPWSIQHMFFGYRGQGVMDNLTNLGAIILGILGHIRVLDCDVFHHTLALWALCIIIFAVVYHQKRKNKTRATKKSQPSLVSKTSSGTWHVVFWPTLVYFLIVGAVSPYIELRYIMPITGLATVLVIAGTYEIVGKVWSEKKQDLMVGGLLLVMFLAAPIQIGLGVMRVGPLYRERANFMSEMENHADTPALYFIASENNRFLDNILPFATLSESYLSLDADPTTESVKEILAGKDLSNGLYLFIAESMDLDKTLETVKTATGFTNAQYVDWISTCGVYYLSFK